MTGTFAAGAERLCGAAAQLLGWRPAEFWAATPAELAACLAGPGSGETAADRSVLDELLIRFPD